MSIPVPLEQLAAALERRSNNAYLLTVGDDGTAHCLAATVGWIGDELIVPASNKTVHNAAARGNVALLSPPVGGLTSPSPGDDGHDAYSLIVDATVTATFQDSDSQHSTVRMRPTHAVLHRPVATADGQVAHDGAHEREPDGARDLGSSCLHDCVHVYDGT